MFVFLSFMRDPGTVIMLRCEHRDAALSIAASNRGANSAYAIRKCRVRPGNRNVNLVLMGVGGNRMGIDRSRPGYWNRLVLSVSEGVDHSKQLIGAIRR
jgi:hypothetical protein